MPTATAATLLTPTQAAPARCAGPPPPGDPSPPGGAGFKQALASTVARTAKSEGHNGQIEGAAGGEGAQAQAGYAPAAPNALPATDGTGAAVRSGASSAAQATTGVEIRLEATSPSSAVVGSVAPASLNTVPPGQAGASTPIGQNSSTGLNQGSTEPSSSALAPLPPADRSPGASGPLPQGPLTPGQDRLASTQAKGNTTLLGKAEAGVAYQQQSVPLGNGKDQQPALQPQPQPGGEEGPRGSGVGFHDLRGGAVFPQPGASLPQAASAGGRCADSNQAGGPTSATATASAAGASQAGPTMRSATLPAQTVPSAAGKPADGAPTGSREGVAVAVPSRPQGQPSEGGKDGRPAGVGSGSALPPDSPFRATEPSSLQTARSSAGQQPTAAPSEGRRSGALQEVLTPKQDAHPQEGARAPLGGVGEKELAAPQRGETQPDPLHGATNQPHPKDGATDGFAQPAEQTHATVEPAFAEPSVAVQTAGRPVARQAVEPSFALLREALLGAASTLRATVALAYRNGSAEARIALSPPSLGALRVHLIARGEGLVARLVAEDPTTAQLLSTHQEGLRSALSELGLAQLSLEVGGRGPDANRLAQGAPPFAHSSPSDGEGEGEGKSPLTGARHLLGALVDVVA